MRREFRMALRAAIWLTLSAAAAAAVHAQAPLATARSPRTRPAAPSGSARAAGAKAQGLDLYGAVSATWGPDGVRMQAERIANTSGSPSPTLYLILWATAQRPVFGDSILPSVLGSYRVGVLAAGAELRNVDTGLVPFTEPVAGCHYVTLALVSPASSGFTYWSFVTFTSGGTPDGHGYSRFAFGGASCEGSAPATPGALYAVENDNDADLYRIDGLPGAPRAVRIGPTGLSQPAIAVDPTTATLFAIEPDGSLYRLDAGTGDATPVGAGNLAGAHLVALAARADGALFAWDTLDTNLYRLDKATANATLVGRTGYSAGGDLVFDAAGTLYGSTGSALVRLDPGSGQATPVGSFGVDSVFGLAIGADGTLYAGRDTTSFSGSSRLYRADRTTGAVTQIGNPLDRSLADLALFTTVGQPPDADFIWSPVHPVTGQQVQFTDESFPDATSWSWNLDGAGADDSTARNPTWTYNAAGTYEVTLRACNASGCTTARQGVTVTAQPALRITGEATGVTLTPLAFTASATGCAANPFGWTWTTDADFDYPPQSLGAINLSGATVVRGWAEPGLHIVRAVNNSCPGAEATFSFRLDKPANQKTWLTKRLTARPQEHPTVVYCHGAQSAGFDAACKSAGSLSCGANLWSCLEHCDGSQVNFAVGDLADPAAVNQFQLVWDGAGQGATGPLFASNYVQSWSWVDDAARQLARGLLDTLGPDYRQPVQFVGHSLGSVVCGQAAVQFLRGAKGVKEAQITALDRPDHVHKLVRSSAFQEFERRFGFAADYFPGLLAGAVRPGLDLRLDNYWASTGAGVGDRTACLDGVSIHNHSSLADPGHVGKRYFPQERVAGIFNDHSGVQQWYRWSMDARGANRIASGKGDGAVCTELGFEAPADLGGTLDPCAAGWNVALANPGAGELPANCGLPLTVTLEPISGCVSSAGSTPCQKRAGESLSLEAGEEPAVKAASATVEIPVYARSVLFELTASKAVAALWAVVRLDRTPIWSGSLAGFPAGQPVELGPVSVYGLTGRRQLSLELVGLRDATVQVRNLRAQRIVPPCATDDALCIAAHRFRIEAEWTTPEGRTGHASPRYVSTDASGFLWFFDAGNLELIVKVLDACAVNRRFWVFAGGLTNVGVRLTVTDTATGAIKVYDNPQGTAFAPIQDTGAFATCSASDVARGASPAARAPAAPAPSPSAKAARLGHDRFEVTAKWRTPGGGTGTGQMVPVTDDSGYLWFFDPSNIELAVKVLDACALNQRFWVFAAGLTDLEVDLTVTDTRTRATATYHNPGGQPFQPIQDTGALATCP